MNYRFSLPLAIFFLFLSLAHLRPALAASGSISLVPSTQECWHRSSKVYAGKTAAERQQLLDDTFDEYRELVNLSVRYRDEAARLLRTIRATMATNHPLRGQDLDLMNRGMLALLDLRQRLYGIATLHRCWLNGSEEQFAAAGLGGLLPKEQVTGILLSLSASLQLYDNYLLLISGFNEDPKLRYFLNQRDSGYDIGSRELDRITLSYNSLLQRQMVREGLQYYEKTLASASPELLQDPAIATLRELIEQSPSYRLLKHPSLFGMAGREIRVMEGVGQDSLHGLSEAGISLFSTLFGNTVGMIQTRNGKLFHRPAVATAIQDRLKAGDILLEKTPFRLTDSFIPGHWGHAAIWIGTQSELQQLGLWDHPVVRPYQEQIRQGKCIVEALRSGVRLSSLPQFLDIDDFGALRPRRLNREQRKERIILALRQVGKGYDFTFNVETTDRIVCSELIYTVYTGMEWPTRKSLGRFTITPDQVAEMALDDSALEIILLYHDGRPVEGDRNAFMTRLLRPTRPHPSS